MASISCPLCSDQGICVQVLVGVHNDGVGGMVEKRDHKGFIDNTIELVMSSFGKAI